MTIERSSMDAESVKLLEPNGKSKTVERGRIEVAALGAGVLVSLLFCAGILVYGSGRGLDLTDEIFYLVWTSDPRAYALLYQPFGYLLHPLFEAVGRNLQAYRLAGFVIAAGSGAFLGHSLPAATGRRLLFASYGALSALLIFFPWIVTPSYNSAANVGAFLIVGGALSAFAEERARIAGSIAAGAGLTIAAFSKPPLFAIGFAAILVTAFVSKKALVPLIASLILGLLGVSIFVAPLELPALVERMVRSQHVLSLPNTPLALPFKIARDWFAVPPPLTGAAIAGALSFALRRTSWSSWAAYAAIALSLYFLASIVPDAIDHEVADFTGLAVMTLVAGYGGAIQHERHRSWPSIALLFVAPVAVGLGTFNNQWFQLNFSMAFPLLALFALAAADSSSWRRRAAEAVALVIPSALMLLAAWAPYSLPASIFEQQVRIKPPLSSGTLLVDNETADFVRGARGLARGALVMDLSGTGPGVAAVLGGHPPVLSWLNPATPTWPNVAWSKLNPTQREAVWFVVPVWPSFEHSAPALWLAAHKERYCRTSLPEIPFWGEERTLEVLRPCAASLPAGARNS